LLGSTGMGIARFESGVSPTGSDWLWGIVFVAVGIFAGFFYNTCQLVFSKVAGKIADKRILSCIIAGCAVALLGLLIPFTMFSGEHDMGEMIKEWSSYSWGILILICFAKLLLTNICISFGWRGGNIFPIIFGSMTLGFAMTALTGVTYEFAVAVVVASTCGYIMKKPIVVAALLLLCFPVTIIIPIGIAACLGSVVPGFKTNN
ncbi:MAG: chloride channel protein, partial [Anaerovoracaceae bacterium]